MITKKRKKNENYEKTCIIEIFFVILPPDCYFRHSRHVKKFGIIVCMLVCGALAWAHTPLAPETRHFLSLHVDAGYSAMLHTIAGQKPSTGVNGMIGFDYRLFHNNFIFSIGAEGMYELNINKMDDHDEAIRMMDTEGDIFQMHVHVDKSRDLAHMANVNIPILFGGEWGRFYFMVGPKVAINLYGMTSSSAQITTYGEYDQYYDDFYDMINHQFVSNQYMSSASMPLKWNFNIMAHAEVGGRVGHMFKHQQFRINPDKIRMFLAAYVDFGLLNLHVSSGGAPVFGYRETEKGVQFYLQPLMQSALADNAVFRNLNVGIKYTIAFELPQKGKSYIYDSNKVGRDYIKRGGNQSIK